MTNDAVLSACVRWLTTLTGVTTIKAFQGIARPALPYLMVEMGPVTELTENPEAFDSVESDNLNSEGLPEIEMTPVIELEWVVMVYSFGEDQSAALRRVMNAAHLSQVQEPLRPTLTIHETGSLNSVPEFVDQQWEPRSVLNVMLRGLSDDAFVIDTIEEHTPFAISKV